MEYKNPTKQDIAIFESAANRLAKLGKKGLYIYFDDDSLCLMQGPSHDIHGNPRRDSVRSIVHIPLGGGGGW